MWAKRAGQYGTCEAPRRPHPSPAKRKKIPYLRSHSPVFSVGGAQWTAAGGWQRGGDELGVDGKQEPGPKSSRWAPTDEEADPGGGQIKRTHLASVKLNRGRPLHCLPLPQPPLIYTTRARHQIANPPAMQNLPQTPIPREHKHTHCNTRPSRPTHDPLRHPMCRARQSTGDPPGRPGR